jgi:hypothetical protein
VDISFKWVHKDCGIICIQTSSQPSRGQFHRRQKASHSSACCSIRCNDAIVTVKSIRERGYPWRKPLLCLIIAPALPLAKIRVEEVLHIISDKRSIHLGPKPNFSISSSMHSHETESNAPAMSSLRNKQGFFFAYGAFIVFLTYRKLSCILRVLMKALLTVRNHGLQTRCQSIRYHLGNNFSHGVHLRLTCL